MRKRSETRRDVLGGLVAATAGAVGSTRAFAQAAARYPERPIRLIVPFPPGGQTDALARITAAEFSNILPQRVVVENVGGAGGNVGAALTARAEPDGYTILFGTAGTHGINPALYRRGGYEAVADFTPISLVATSANMIIAHPSFAANNLKELIELARSKPGEIDYATAGNGTTPHLTAEFLQEATGIKLKHVPYRGSGPAMTDLLGGHIKLMFDGLPSALGALQGRQVKGIAVSSIAREPAAAEIPAMSETLPQFEVLTWFALVGPRGLDPAIVDRLNGTMTEFARSETVRKRFAELGSTPKSSTPKELAAHIDSELARWAKLIQRLGISIE